jgi:hypothetical protein
MFHVIIYLYNKLAINPPTEPPVIPPREKTPVEPRSDCTIGAAGVGDSPYNGEPVVD